MDEPEKEVEKNNKPKATSLPKKENTQHHRYRISSPKPEENNINLE